MTEKITDREKRADFPKTLAEVLTCSTSVMANETKVLLLALIYRYVKDKDTRSLPVRLEDMARATGMPFGEAEVAALQLHAMDYLDYRSKTVSLIKGHPIMRGDVNKFFSVPDMKLGRMGEFVDEKGDLKPLPRAGDVPAPAPAPKPATKKKAAKKTNG